MLLVLFSCVGVVDVINGVFCIVIIVIVVMFIISRIIMMVRVIKSYFMLCKIMRN